MNSVQPNTPLRVEAFKGFYATIAGQFGVVNPGDVVECERAVATMAIASGKAQLTTKDLKRDPKYVPERKRNPKPSTEDLLTALVRATEANTQAIAALVASNSKSVKKD